MTTHPAMGWDDGLQKNMTPRAKASVLLLCLLVSSIAAARNVALLVAVGQFRDPALKSFELRGPAIDIDSVQQTLGMWRFAPGDVVTLRDQDATHDRILAEISALERRTSSG